MAEQTRCPSCDAVLRVPESLLGSAVKCPKCQTTFTAEVGGAPPEAGFVEEPARPGRRPMPPPEEDAGYDEEDRPRRPRRGRGRSAEAASAVAGPAIALMVVGGLAIALSLLSLVLNLAGVGMMAAQQGGPRNAQQTDVMAQGVGGVFGAIFGMCWGGVILAGAVQMKGLRSYAFAMTSCIVAMVPCNICCLLGLPFGIWGIVMLNKPEVKDAFS